VADDTVSTSSNAALDLVVDKATDSFRWWQQVPAWILGLSAIVGGGFLIAFPKHLKGTDPADAWAAVIIALVLAVLLSYRSAFTLTEGGAPSKSDGPSRSKTDTPAPSKTGGGT
jgi:hypothetical protein